MRTRTLAITGLLAAGLLLTACSSTPSSTPDRTAAAPSSKAAAGGASLQQPFGKTYAWPDGVKVTVTQAKVFTGYDKSLGEKATPGSTDYQVSVKVTNGSPTPLDLGSLSVITVGATSGGEAEATAWGSGSDALQGRLAPGAAITKADDETLGTKYGRKIVVTVQRSTDDGTTAAFPEFSGSIAG